MAFIKRTTSPTTKTKWYKDNNPFYNSKYSMFKSHPKYLGNCVHYAYSRSSEIMNKKSNLPTCNAIKWFNKTIYKKGNIPYQGSIICYKNNKSGHVAIVEEIKDEEILISMSGWNSYLFKTKKVYKKNNYNYSNNELIGFIYLPNINYYNDVFPTLPKCGYLKKGDKGDNIKKLQKLLNWLNDSSLNVDGIIGNKTINEIKKFQNKVKIKIDGLFGKDTLEHSIKYLK